MLPTGVIFMFSNIFKWSSVILTYGLASLFYLDKLPPYHTFTSLDTWLWVIGLGSLSTVQAVFLICKVRGCYICRIWSDFILQFTGLLLVFLAGIFSAKYPPLSWAMGVFPVVGVLYLAIGRILSRQSRQCLREQNGVTKPY